MPVPPCGECERQWSAYSHVLRQLYKILVAAELSGNRLGIKDLEDSRALLRDAFRKHALTHSGEARGEGEQKRRTIAAM